MPNENAEIINIEATDFDRLISIARSAILESVTATPVEKVEIIRETRNHLDTALTTAKNVCLKSIIRNDVTGFIIVKEYWNLSDLYVDPRYHQLTHGRMLLQAAIEQCRSVSNKSFIRVNSSLNAQAFYRKFGFTDYQTERALPSTVIPLVFNY